MVLASSFVFTTVASMARSLAAIAVACMALASWPPMIVVASPAAAIDPVPSHTSVSFISWPCC